MHIKRLYLMIAAGVLVLLLFANVLQFVLWGQKIKHVKASSEEEQKALEARIGSIGKITKAWTVANQVRSGQKVVLKDLKSIELLEKSMGEAYITNPDEISGKFYKVSILPGTPLTKDIIMEEKIPDSLRQFDVVANIIPVGLKAGDYIDCRFVMPEGQDYIVLTHKRVEGVYGKTVTLNMTEEEIHIYQSMIIDYFLKEGSFVYLTRYLEPGVQEPAKTFYPIRENIQRVLLIDPNIIEKIETSIIKDNRDLSDVDEELSDNIKALIRGGRSSIQGNIDSANMAFWDGIDKASKGIGTQNGNLEGQIPQQPQTQQPQANTNQTQQSQVNANQTQQVPANANQTQQIPANTQPSNEPSENIKTQDEGSNGDGALNIQEGVVE